MDEIKTLLEQATALAKEGKLEESRALREQAAELRQIKTEEAALKAASMPPPVDTTNRLPFGTAAVAAATDVAEPSTYSTAVKSIYIKKYGAIEQSTEQVLRELYADTGIKNVNDYYTLREVKYRDLTRYCKTGNYDPRLMSLMLYTPEQIVHGIMAGVPVEEGGYNFKATMVEAQDQLGGLTARFN